MSTGALKTRQGTLTQESFAIMIAAIRAGAYPHVAAAAVGMSSGSFISRYRNDPEFAAAIDKAHGAARLRAEIRVAQLDPATWLLKGPGRERQSGDPGWATRTMIDVSAKPAAPPAVLDLSKLTWAELQEYERLNNKLLAPGGTKSDPARES